MLIAALGAMLMVCAQNLAAMFISLELLSVPLYGMLAYAFMRSRSLEAGLKYLVLSATASATPDGHGVYLLANRHATI